MGVFGIRFLVDRQLLPNVEVTEFENNSQILVDGDSFAYKLMDSLNLSKEVGLSMNQFTNSVNSVLELARRQRIKFVFAFDSTPTSEEKTADKMQRLSDKVKQVSNVVAQINGVSRPRMRTRFVDSPQNELMTILKQQNFHELITTLGEADNILAQVMRDNDEYKGVLSGDSDFLFFRGCTLFDINSFGVNEKGRLETKRLSRNELMEFFGLPDEKCHLLSAFCGNDFTKPFLKEKSILRNFGLKLNRFGFSFPLDVAGFLKSEEADAKIAEVYENFPEMKDLVEYSRKWTELEELEPFEADLMNDANARALVKLTIQSAAPAFLLAFKARGWMFRPSFIENYELPSSKVAPMFDVTAMTDRAILSLLGMEKGEYRIIEKDSYENVTRELKPFENIPSLTEYLHLTEEERYDIFCRLITTSRFFPDEPITDAVKTIFASELPKSLQNTMLVLFSWLIQCDGFCHFLTKSEIEAFIATAVIVSNSDETFPAPVVPSPEELASKEVSNWEVCKGIMENKERKSMKKELLMEQCSLSEAYFPRIDCKFPARPLNTRRFSISRMMEDFVRRCTTMADLLIIPHLFSRRVNMFEPEIFNRVMCSSEATISLNLSTSEAKMFEVAKNVFFKLVATSEQQFEMEKELIEKERLHFAPTACFGIAPKGLCHVGKKEIDDFQENLRICYLKLHQPRRQGRQGGRQSGRDLRQPIRQEQYTSSQLPLQKYDRNNDPRVRSRQQQQKQQQNKPQQVTEKPKDNNNPPIVVEETKAKNAVSSETSDKPSSIESPSTAESTDSTDNNKTKEEIEEAKRLAKKAKRKRYLARKKAKKESEMQVQQEKRKDQLEKLVDEKNKREKDEENVKKESEKPSHNTSEESGETKPQKLTKKQKKKLKQQEQQQQQQNQKELKESQNAENIDSNKEKKQQKPKKQQQKQEKQQQQPKKKQQTVTPKPQQQKKNQGKKQQQQQKQQKQSTKKDIKKRNMHELNDKMVPLPPTKRQNTADTARKPFSKPKNTPKHGQNPKYGQNPQTGRRDRRDRRNSRDFNRDHGDSYYGNDFNRREGLNNRYEQRGFRDSQKFRNQHSSFQPRHHQDNGRMPPSNIPNTRFDQRPPIGGNPPIGQQLPMASPPVANIPSMAMGAPSVVPPSFQPPMQNQTSQFDRHTPSQQFPPRQNQQQQHQHQQFGSNPSSSSHHLKQQQQPFARTPIPIEQPKQQFGFPDNVRQERRFDNAPQLHSSRDFNEPPAQFNHQHQQVERVPPPPSRRRDTRVTNSGFPNEKNQQQPRQFHPHQTFFHPSQGYH